MMPSHPQVSEPSLALEPPPFRNGQSNMIGALLIHHHGG